MQRLKNVHELFINLCLSNLPCILLFNYLLKKPFLSNLQDTIIIKQCLYCQLCNNMVYGIAYKILNALYLICSLTEAKLPSDENNFVLLFCNSPMDIWTSTCNFRSYGTRANVLTIMQKD